jgi:predicted nucleic acid-binding Zn ribbon protein
MNTNLANALKRIVGEKGEAILDDSRQVNQLLTNYAPNESKSEKKALITCIMDGCHKTLRNSPESGRLNCKIQLAQKLHNEEGLETALCENALDILEQVFFGKITQRPQPVQQPQAVNYPQYVPPQPASRPVVSPITSAPVTPIPVQVFSKYCSHCGAGLVDAAVICVKCGCKVNEEKHGRRRNGFTTFFLILWLIGIVLGTVFVVLVPDFVFLIYPYATDTTAMFVIGVGVMLALSLIMLLRWKKMGFWIFALMAFVPVFLEELNTSDSPIIVGLIQCAILYGVLHLRKDGKSAWEQLE